MTYQLTIWFKEQRFLDPNVPDMQVTTSNVKQINDYLENNWMYIRRHDIKCVTTGEQCH
jgi:hypothetical protein